MSVDTYVARMKPIVFQINNFPSTGSGNEFPEPVEGSGVEI